MESFSTKPFVTDLDEYLRDIQRKADSLWWKRSDIWITTSILIVLVRMLDPVWSLLFAVGLPVVAYYRHQNFLHGIYTHKLSQRWLADEETFMFDQQGFGYNLASGEHGFVPWTNVVRAQATPKAILLFTTVSAFSYVPKSAFATSADLDALTSFLSERGILK